MDSLTQITLGAAVGEAVAGREARGKAPLWGAFLGTLPDLDVLANPFLTEAQSLLFHRGPSHSLLVAALLAPLLGVALARLHRDGPTWKRWTVLVAAVLLTHIGLDCLTVYGTQVFWPFTRVPVLYGTIFIIDPLYTLPLAAGLLTALWWTPTARRRRLANYAGLALSSAYLLFTLGNKLYVNQVVETSLQTQNLPTERVLTKPTAFNNLLWMGLSEGQDGFYVGYYSLLDDDQNISFEYVPKRHDLLGDAADNPFVDRLRWFSRGYFVVRRAADGTLTVQDLRFGRNDLGLTSSGEYIFTFRLIRDDAGAISGFRQVRPPMQVDGALLRRFVDRVGGQELADPPSRNVSVKRPGSLLGSRPANRILASAFPLRSWQTGRALSPSLFLPLVPGRIDGRTCK
jgi:inner membrane protein